MKKIICIAMVLILSVGMFACNGKIEKPTANTQIAMLNSGFEEEIGNEVDYGWDVYKSDAELELDKTQKSVGESSLKCTTVIGGYVSLWQVLPIKNAKYSTKFNKQITALDEYGKQNNSRLARNGDEVEMSMDIRISSENFPEDLSLINFEIKSENSKKVPKIIAKAKDIKIEPNKWTKLTTAATVDRAIIPDESVLIVANFNMDIPEGNTVNIDNFSIKAISDGEEIPGDTPTEEPKYTSRGEYIQLENEDFEVANCFDNGNLSGENNYFGTKSLKLNGEAKMTVAKGKTSIKTVSASIWAFGNEDKPKSITLQAYNGDILVGSSKKETMLKNKWVYLKTPTMNVNKPFDKLVVTLSATDSNAYFDYVQIGDEQRINGNKQKTAIMAYQPWFGTATEGNWGNWKYDSSAAGGRMYNPSTIIGDGASAKRDIASVYYPLIGAYRSNSKEVIDYQVKLIKSMGIDVIQANYYADLSSAKYQKDVISKLFDACEQEGLKMSVLYEPKIHLNGWIPHNTRTAAINAIAKDIANFINLYKDRKSLLQYNGAPVIEIFGLNLLTGSEWGTVIKKVQELTGVVTPIMGDGISNNDYTNITSMFHWNLYNSSLSDCNELKAKEFCKNNNKLVYDWTDANIGEKLGVGMVFPGFDDTPVRSWGNKPNSPIRKISNTGAEFYNASFSAFFEDADKFDWVIIATFNDWTEGTVIEPTRENGHDLAVITANNIAKFKGQKAATKAEIEKITADYLNSRTEKYI